MAPIIFVHGAGLSASFWRNQTDFFPDSIAVDLPGHGDSDGPLLASIGEYATWLGEEIRRTGAEPVTLVGHSMGSLVALETAARNADMVSRLVLIGTAADMSVNPRLLEAARARDASVGATIIKWSLPSAGSYGRPKRWVLAISNDFIKSAEDGVLANDLTACTNYTAALDMAGRVRCPALLILGEHDKMTPAPGAQPLAAALEDARIIVVEKVGHMSPLEKPATVNETIDLFLGIE